MKVLFLFSIGDMQGGAVRVWFNLLDGLYLRGVEPYVVIPQDKDGSVAAALQERGIPYAVLFHTWWVTDDPAPHSIKRRIRRAGAHRLNEHAEGAIESIIRNRGIDLVYICDGTITAGLKAAKNVGVPVVWHFHQFIQGGRGGISFIDSDEKVARTLAMADRILTVTKAMRDDLLERYPSCGSIEAVYNGIDPKGTLNKKVVFAGEQVVFTLAGRFDANKGQPDAVEAFLRIAPDYPEIRLELVGTGSDTAIAAIKDRISHHRHGARVILRGQCSDMPSVWARTDVALNCSFSEGCSMVIAEAMSNGCLVLASDAPSNAELLGDKRGIIYRRCDVEDLAAKMRWVLENRGVARSVASEGRVFAQQAFDLSTQVDRIYSVFEGLLP